MLRQRTNLGSRDRNHCLLTSCSTQGKVRDVYELEDNLVIVTTDRQSAFDRLLAAVPFKVRSLHA